MNRTGVAALDAGQGAAGGRRTTPVASNSAGRGGEEVDRVLLPVRLEEPDPAAARRTVQRGAPHPAQLGDGGRRQRDADGAAGVHGDAELRGQPAGELEGGGDGEGHVARRRQAGTAARS